MSFPPYATNLEKLKVAFSLVSEVYTDLARELGFKAVDRLAELAEASRALDRFISVILPDLRKEVRE